MMILKGHKDLVRDIAYSPDGGTLASGSNDKTVRLWDVFSGKERFRLKPHKRIVYSVGFAPDGMMFASGSADRSVRLWDVATGEVRQTLETHPTSVTTVAFSRDGKKLLTGSGNPQGDWPEGQATVFSLTHGRTPAKELSTLLVGHSGVHCGAFAPDNRTVALGTGMKVVVLWQPKKAEAGTRFGVTGDHYVVYPVWEPPQPKAPGLLQQGANARCLAFSPDGQTLATSSGWSAHLWRYGQASQSCVLSGHKDNIWSLAFSPSGRILLTGSYDGTVRKWNLLGGQQVRVFDWEIGRIHSLAIAPDGMTAAAGGEEDIIVWDLDEN